MNAPKESRSATFLDSENERFWLARIQTHNWGTYGGVHDFTIAREGFMFVGPSGSGKSTALDAHATLMTPGKWLGFNTAAVGAQRLRSDRTLMSYVRGAWGDKTVEDGSLESARQYLRTGSTWSVIAETYRNDAGGVVTLAQVLWTRGASSASSDLRRLYLVFTREFDVKELEEFAESDFNVRQLKGRMPDAMVKDEFSGYQEVFRRLLGIESEGALRLLHKTQSAKDLADLNTFLRDFMLDSPETFDIANDLVEQFSELNDAHSCVIEAERQIQTLEPARDAGTRRQSAQLKRGEMQEIASAIDAHVEQRKAALLKERIDQLGVVVAGALEEARALLAVAEAERDKLNGLERERFGLGGAEIGKLESEIVFAENQKDDRLRKRDQLEQACRGLGWDLPINASRLAEQNAQAKAMLDAAPEATRTQDAARLELHASLARQTEEFAKLRREIESMERQRSSIPARMLDLRDRLCAALRVPESQAPFAGELIDVLPSEANWRGAIERALGAFALSLLVPEARYERVSQWINDEHLGTRLVYFRVGAAPRTSMDHTPGPHSLARKLTFADHPLAAWAREEIKSRFDYACVENMEAFRSAPRMALTLRGQIKHTAARHEKNDTNAIDDPRHWVLGFNNSAKLELYRTSAAELAQGIADSQRSIAAHEAAQNESARAIQRCVTIANATWSDIDVVAMVERVTRLREQIERERRARPALTLLDKQLGDQKGCYERADKLARDKRSNADSAGRDRVGLEKRLGALSPERLALALTPTQSAGLVQRFATSGRDLTLNSIDEIARLVERALSRDIAAVTEEINREEIAMSARFAEFIRNWPQDASGLDASIESAQDFFAKLERLLLEGLPRFRERFERLLHDHSAQSLSRLATRLELERAAISDRLEIVNESLRSQEYNAGTRLEIACKDRVTEDLREFRADLRGALSHALGNDRDRAEARFLILKRIVRRLSSPDPVDRMWRQQVLDVRQHVEFIAKEMDEAGLEIEIYRGGAGKSGGQRQKLTLSCLAAALRFQLGGADGEPPKYRTVVIDEAFEKADTDFTTLTMRIFESMGFQMVVATPMKAVMALEPFIGGACFVFSPNRRASAHLPIDYDAVQRRLILTPELRERAGVGASEGPGDAEPANA